MNRHFYRGLVVSLAIATALLFLGNIPPLSMNAALAQVTATGTFTATRSCEAPRAINGANPRNIRVAKGQRYEAVGFNSEEQRFILIKVPGANPERRWVSASCGTFSEVASSPTPGDVPNSPSALKPFFDTVDNPEQHGFPRAQKVDITPPPPELNAFDKAVLNTCGSFNSKVEPKRFQDLMSTHPDVLNKIKAAVGDELLPGSQKEFLGQLTAIWFDEEGFEHIFCGEKKQAEKPNDDIGGLHFVGRYWQLQEQGIGGRLPNNLKKEEVIPGLVFTLGVGIKYGDGILKDDLKGYAFVSNAEELLLDATKAFKTFKVQGTTPSACIYPVLDKETGESFKAVFVKNKSGIVTFYSDATPAPNGNSCGN